MSDARLILVNGAPGSGKSTIAQALAQCTALALALDIDAIKHALGHWEDDPAASGWQARRIALAMAGEQLSGGFDVVLGQYLAKPEFIEELEALAAHHDVQFFEFILHLDTATLAERLGRRARHPDRPEHEILNRLVGPVDAEALVGSLEPLRQSRPQAVWVDARGPLPTTLRILRALLNAPVR